MRPILGCARLAIGAALCTAALLAGCAKTEDIHETKEAAGQACANCHRAAFAAAASPVHVGQFPDTCNSCHTTNGWSPAALPDHHWFTLDGKHASTSCKGCHTGEPPRYAGTPSDCASCHLPSYTTAMHPVHVNVLPQTCGNCHSREGWTPATVDQHPWFVLDGHHAITPCVSCHTGDPKRFRGTPSTCDACHDADYQRSTFPGHSAFSKDCKACHKTGGW